MFQQSVIQQHLAQQNASEITEKYQQFCAIFHNADKQANIRASKEEQYQEGFLNDLFVQILGYTLNPNPNYNLITEQKNTTNSKKADGAIWHNEQIIAVIELKGTDTVNLDNIVQQAFGYKNNHAHCRYVIIANFQKLRFYIQNATEYVEFNLFTLSETEFSLLYLLLQHKNLTSGLPEKIKAQSLSAEEAITKQLYTDYSAFKRDLFADLIAQNPQRDKLALFQKSQKLLDRLLFVFFAEDCRLLPPNAILEIVENWKKLKQLDVDIPLYDRIKQYFGWLNEGNADKNIFAYNGGLFKPDDALDTLKISDELLEKHCTKISQYDFSSQIDVNILGHIFEHSLNEIDEIHAELRGESVDKKQTKRKKDGVFYTPKYITQYIVQNTVGKLCEQKKAELGLTPEYLSGFRLPEKGMRKETVAKLLAAAQEPLQKIEDYRHWLLNITICDPACGSGAFLNEALNFLIAEHTQIDEMQSRLAGSTMVFQDIEHAILERNLYGVDINPESVEIAKLSLWLRTAQRHRKLNNLNNNIVCGNSLIDGETVSGSLKPFSWQSAFPQVFERGGFDVIIGNPPYFNVQTLGANSPVTKYLQTNYSDIWQDKSDILFYFISLAMKISKNKIGYIISNAFLFSDKAQKLRNAILKDNRLNKIINFEKYMVFEDASITSCILIFDKDKINTKAMVLKNKDYAEEKVIEYLNNSHNEFPVELQKDSVFALVDNKIMLLNQKIDSNHRLLQDVIMIGKGMETAANGVFSFEELPTQFPDEFVKKQMIGENISRYYLNPQNSYLLYFEHIDKYEDLPLSIKEHLEANRDILENRATVKNEGRIWWRYSRPMHKEFYHLNKIWCSYRSATNKFILDESSEYIGLTNTTVIFDTNKEISLKYLLTLLNSKLFYFRYQSIGKQTGSGVYEYFANGVGKFPIPEISLDEQQPFIELADKMLQLNRDFQAACAQFLRLQQRRFALDKPSKALQSWHELSFQEWTAALKKHKINLSLKDELEWEELFTSEQSKVAALQAQIAATDREIDQRVFALYGLTDDEIALVQAA